MRISDWSSDVCSSDLCAINRFEHAFVGVPPALRREGGHAEEDTHQLAPLAQLVVDVTPFLALLAQLRQEARRLGVRKARGAHELEARLVRRCQRIGNSTHSFVATGHGILSLSVNMSPMSRA